MKINIVGGSSHIGAGCSDVKRSDGWKEIPNGDGISRDGITKLKPGI